MVDFVPRRRSEASLKEMTLEELLEKLKTKCIRNEEGDSLFTAHLLKRGVEPGLIVDFCTACCDIGRLKDLPVQNGLAGELPVDNELREAIQEADRLERAILTGQNILTE